MNIQKKILSILLFSAFFINAASAFAGNAQDANQGGMWDKTKDVSSDVWAGTKDVASDVWDGTKKVTSDVWAGTKEVGSDIKEGITGDDDTAKPKPKANEPMLESN